MKAIRVHEFGDPNVMKLEDVPDPTPKAGEVVVKLAAIGVNPVDAYIRAGTYGPRPFPFTPGTDAAGTVEAVGEGVTGVKPGDRVYVAGAISGTYAEKALCQAAQVQPLPDHITFAQGAAIGVPYVTASIAACSSAPRRVPARRCWCMARPGASASPPCRLAVAAGLTVIATGGTDEGRKLVSEQGAAHVLDHHAQATWTRSRA